MKKHPVVKNLVILLLAAALLIPVFPAAQASGTYQHIDFSQAVLASRINQQISQDCAVVSMATIESYMHGATSASDKETVYNAVVKANGAQAYAYWSNVGYLQYDYIDWAAIYERLTWGVPSIIHRTKGSNSVQHWAVVAGYNGSTTTLEWNKFIVVDVYLGYNVTDIKSAEAWGYGCEIDRMSLRGSGMSIPLYSKTRLDLGESFYASIGRKDSPGELLTVAEAADGTSVYSAAADQSDRQRWRFVRQDDGSYVIESVHSGYVLNVNNGSSVDGTMACVWKALGNPYQKWYVYQTETGYMLESVGTGKSVTVYPAGTGQNASLNTYSQSAAQILNIHIHTYVLNVIDPDCTNDGYKRMQCSGCGDYYIESGEAATGHQWQEGQTIPADCQQTRQIRYACSVCGQTKQEYEEKTYSDWMESYPKGVSEAGIETQTQYRFRDRFSSWDNPVLVQLDYVSQWPAGFDTGSTYYTSYNKAPVVAYEGEDQRLDVISDEIEGYLYYHWCRGYTGGPINRRVNTEYSSTYCNFHAFFSTADAAAYDAQGAYGEGARYFYNSDCCLDSWWYLQIPVYRQTYLTQQKLQTEESWTAWSDWGSKEIQETQDRQVQTRTVYRYCTNLAEHTYSDGKDTTCNVCAYVREVKQEKIETTPMYRLYNPNSGEHFYTGSQQERDMLTAAGWQYEGVAWNAPTKQGEPVYRVYNPNSGDHHYTMSWNEVTMLTDLGWQYEGVAWNSAGSENIPQYRLYNPNADCGSHHYTSSTQEMDDLVSLGWIYEGIGWYGMLK